jgi:endoribonuclease Dicer
VDPTTGGLISPQNATTAIYRFCSALKTPSPGVRSVFIFEEGEELGECSHICTINLPGTLIDGLTSSSTVSKAYARRTLCFSACQKLADNGLLDPRFFFVSRHSNTGKSLSKHHSSPDMAAQAWELPTLGDKGTRRYDKRRPQFWSNHMSSNIVTLYPVVMSFDDMAAPHAPMVILSRNRLPQLRTFNIFTSGSSSLVSFTHGREFVVNSQELSDLFMYTLRICRIITNRPCSCHSVENMRYFFAPLPSDWKPVSKDTSIDVRHSIPWKDVNLTANTWAVPLKYGGLSEVATDVADAVVIDRWTEFTRRYLVAEIRPDLSPLSKIEEVSEHNDNIAEKVKFRRVNLLSMTISSNIRKLVGKISKF